MKLAARNYSYLRPAAFQLPYNVAVALCKFKGFENSCSLAQANQKISEIFGRPVDASKINGTSNPTLVEVLDAIKAA